MRGTMIKPDTIAVRNLFGEGDVKLEVPNFQRAYDWGKEQAEEMWQDLEAVFSSEKPVYLGTIVLDVSGAAQKEPTKIVDGQQRLTTLFILLAACRDEAKKMRNDKLAGEIQRKIAFTDDTTGETTGTRLIVSDSIRDVFNATIVSDNWDGSFPQKRKRQVKKIKPIYEFFIERISRVVDSGVELKVILEAVYRATLIKIVIDDSLDAFEIFERTNARGLELNAADLLKNYLFAKKASDDLEEIWNKIVERTPGNILRMMKYFWVSKFGYIQKKNLYDSLRRYGNETGAPELLSELDRFSGLYSLIVAGSENDIKEWLLSGDIKELKKDDSLRKVSGAFHAFRLFGVSQVIPLLVSAIEGLNLEKTSDRPGSVKKFLAFIKGLENYHFINSAVCQRPGNEVEMYYAEMSKALAEKKDSYRNLIDAVLVWLREHKAGAEEFNGKFRELSYDQSDNLSLIYYFFDRYNNLNRRVGELFPIYNPDIRVIKKSFSIEHVLSQDPSEHHLTKEDVADFIHNIGNLLIVGIYTNSVDLGNKSIPEKIKILNKKQKQLPAVADFIEKYEDYEWDGKEDMRHVINERTQDLAKRAYEQIWIV